MKQEVNSLVGTVSLTAVIVASFSWTCLGDAMQEWRDQHNARFFAQLNQINQSVQNVLKSVEEAKQRDAELEARAVRGYLHYEKLVNLNVGSFDQWGARRELTNAMRAGNWQQAVGLCELILIKTGQDDPVFKRRMTPFITRLSDYVMLAFLDLNVGRSDKATANLETAIEMMTRKYGAETARSATALLAEVRAGNANVTYPDGQVWALTQAITAAAKIEDDIQQGQLDAMLNAELAKGRAKLQLAREKRYQTALQQRAWAKEEFKRNTGLDFDDTYRPRSEGPVQREWDWCEKMLSIWKVVEKPN